MAFVVIMMFLVLSYDCCYDFVCGVYACVRLSCVVLLIVLCVPSVFVWFVKLFRMSCCMIVRDVLSVVFCFVCMLWYSFVRVRAIVLCSYYDCLMCVLKLYMILSDFVWCSHDSVGLCLCVWFSYVFVWFPVIVLCCSYDWHVFLLICTMCKWFRMIFKWFCMMFWVLSHVCMYFLFWKLCVWFRVCVVVLMIVLMCFLRLCVFVVFRMIFNMIVYDVLSVVLCLLLWVCMSVYVFVRLSYVVIMIVMCFHRTNIIQYPTNHKNTIRTT